MKDDLIKTAPPLGVTGMEVFGIPAPDLVQILTIIWLVVLIFDKVGTLVAKYMEKKNGQSNSLPACRPAPDRDGSPD